MAPKEPPAEVAEIRHAIAEFFSQTDDSGTRIGAACGVYAFFDYDGEPIYVGQTVEGLAGRVGRHLTGRRSDAVGKFVLDPFEVLDIEVWPVPRSGLLNRKEKRVLKPVTDRIEYAVYQQALAGSRFGAVLNEGVIQPAEPIDLPPSYRGRIIPDDLYATRVHPDIRLARRAATIASLARLISERQIGKGLRTTLRVQCQRLEALSSQRLADFAEDPDEVEDDSADSN